jgi:hypothetical protein
MASTFMSPPRGDSNRGRGKGRKVQAPGSEVASVLRSVEETCETYVAKQALKRKAKEELTGRVIE